MAVAFTEQAAPRPPDLLPLWHKSAPRSLRESSILSGPFGGWIEWQNHLKRRKRPELPRYHRGNEPALMWGWPGDWQRAQFESLLASPTGTQTLAIKFSLADDELDAVAADSDLPRALE
jgi:hypothetical protein